MAEVFRIFRNWGSPVLQEEGNPKRANDSSTSRVYKSHSVFLRLMKVRWEVHLERASQLDYDWKVIGAEGRKGARSIFSSIFYCKINEGTEETGMNK